MSSPIAFRNYLVCEEVQHSCETEWKDHRVLEKNDLIMNLAHLCCQLASLLKMLEKSISI